MDTSLKKSDVIEKLVKEVKQLENKFSEIFLEKKNIENELYTFKLDYNSRIAPFYLEKLKIDVQINEILKKRGIQLEDFKYENNYQPEDIDQETFESQEEYFENQNTEREKIEENTKTLSEEDLVELKRLYKKLAIKFHPDKFYSDADKQERALELMKRINQAFQEKDLDTLRRIEAEGFDLQYEDNQIDESVLTVKRDDLEKNIENIKLDIENTQKSDLYKLYQSYIEKGEEEFYKTIIDEIKNDIKKAVKLLKSLHETKI